MNVKTVLSSIESVLRQETEGDDLFIAEHISEKVGEVLVNCRELLQRFESVEVFLTEFPHLEDVIANFEAFTQHKKIKLRSHSGDETHLEFETDHVTYSYASIDKDIKNLSEVTTHGASFKDTSLLANDICGALTALSKQYFIASLTFSPNETDEIAIKHLLGGSDEKSN